MGNKDRITAKPNILFILADDLGWGDVGYHGSVIKTPNIDRLVAQGLELDQHYVAPMCTPTRAAFLTGMFPSRFGPHATLPTCLPIMEDGYPTLASLLRNVGYDTGLFGKWHLGSDLKFIPNNYGFNYSYGSMSGGVDPYNHRYKKGPYSNTWHENGKPIQERGHVTDLLTEKAISWIESREQPWFCYLAFTAVHIPVKAPEEWLDRYESCVYDPDPEKDRSFKRYAAYVSHMDYAVGQVIEALKRMELLENTIIVFASDNGAIDSYPDQEIYSYPGLQWPAPRLGSNLPLRGGKGELYEGGIRTPAVIYWEGTIKPGKCHTQLHIGDWAPTFLGLAGNNGQESLAEWDGLDIWPILSGWQQQRDKPIYWNISDSKFAIRSGDWKLIIDDWEQPEKYQLFNLRFDPYETTNLAQQHQDVVTLLVKLIIEERKLDGSLERSDVRT